MQSRLITLKEIATQNRGFAGIVFAMPRSEAEDSWLGERFPVLSARESLALAAATMRRIPETAVDAINLLMSLPNHRVLTGVHDYEGLGRQLIEQQGIELPESVLKYTDLFRLGIEYENEHPGLFIGDCYVMYPESPLEAPYDGYSSDTLCSDDWSVRLRLTSARKPEGVWLHLPDFSDANSIAGLNEVEVALHDLGSQSLEECGIAEARCILPEAGNLLEQYTDAESLISDANDLGAMLIACGGVEPLQAMLSLVGESCNTLRSILDTMDRFEFVSAEEMEDFAWEELKQYGIPECWLEERYISLRDYAAERLVEQGYSRDKETGIYSKPKETEQAFSAMTGPQM